MKNIKTIEFKDNILYLIDQRKLPVETEFFDQLNTKYYL